MGIPFIKMEGTGNDYVYLDLVTGRGPRENDLADLPGLARQMSDRHFGIGGDGLILIRPSEKADARMQMFNADGSEGEMCGNGIRCVARFLYEEGVVRKPVLTVETLAGVLELFVTADGGRFRSVKVNMGKPRLDRGEIPMKGKPGTVIAETLAVGDLEVEITALSMGNPHCVIFVPDVAQAPVTALGPLIENHPAFPNRTNVEFVEVVGPGEIRQRTWERGSGETLACGTGASAACVAGILNKKTQGKVLNHLRGGDLLLEWEPGGAVTMEGPAREAFRGTWNAPAG